MDKLNGEIKDIFATFKTDLSGIRVKKLVRLVKTVQATIPDIEQMDQPAIQVIENGHSINVSRSDKFWELHIDEASIKLDATNVYDDFGNLSHCKDLAPQVIHTILNAA